MNRSYSIDEISRMTGLSKYTLRYYEKENLLKNIARDEHGYRKYSEKNLEWITFLLKVKKTGMPINSLKYYADLMERGDETIPERKSILRDHQKRILQEKAELSQALEVIERKFKMYDERLSKQREEEGH
ncbi:MerR family transcriptional regulator [Sporolactobacillus shoreicorticis]|uniref:MerR family transcriptional regulator n=1 Tax=Sporolactobacillus shoreicorticis TaxID=1923877 RepID=A0ABW5S3D4_9BACL|nr:MerR family transcriptional regulator [Sporolactobacillus shoreicorticis]MCO7125431.1 MerR family transcriptional regulator [Sporolactobacillus shoreicorticis]